MTKKVFITVRGEHTVDGVPQEPVEVRTAGRYYFRGGRHYLLYDEFPEGGSMEDPPLSYSEDTGKRIRNLVKFNDDEMEVSKTGGTESHMHFEKGRLHMTQYRTPTGILELGVETSAVRLHNELHRIEMQVDYTLYAGGARIQDSRVTVTVIPYPVL